MPILHILLMTQTEINFISLHNIKLQWTNFSPKHFIKGTNRWKFIYIHENITINMSCSHQDLYKSNKSQN